MIIVEDLSGRTARVHIVLLKVFGKLVQRFKTAASQQGLFNTNMHKCVWKKVKLHENTIEKQKYRDTLSKK